MKKALKTFQWILSGFMALVALAFFPSFSSVLSIVFAVLCAPIGPMQNFLASRKFNGLAKGGVLSALFVSAIVATPTNNEPPGAVIDETPAIVEEQMEAEKPDIDGTIESTQLEVSEEQTESFQKPETAQIAEPDSEPAQELSPESPPHPAPQTEQPKPEPDPAPGSIQQPEPEKAHWEWLKDYNYVGSSESDKYHYPRCRWTREINADNLVHFDTIEEAAAMGYSACGTCNP